ncbi:hypothetical protein GP486_002257 [Trichoglossum hirsutum]|uniref:DDT domain-containing protein n=1 Tax=Trichoglossum hirsutum TaxID=265104 RepID=A0A9P8LFJ4_9PEZI|nr:hypothetical protein GP486_002257 [Trichoglossum hirsutum]
MDFYKQKRFICEITGHSALTFFDALKSETPLSFKEDFYPGENVTVAINGGERLSGTIREKTRFQGFLNQDGTMQPPFQRYFVRLTNQPDREALVDEKHLFRDRKAFTKAMLRSFIKNTVTRDAWTGAPWIVKEHIAVKYRIDTTVPQHLTYASHIAEKKANLAQKKDDTNSISVMNGMVQTLPELRPKSHKSKQEQALGKNQKLREQTHRNESHGTSGAQSNGGSSFINNFNHNFPVIRPPPKASHTPTPPPLKLPAEDLEIPPARNVPHRPPLKHLSQDNPAHAKGTKNVEGNGILMESVGSLLETWNTLNVYCEVYCLDSFTFDDYVEALQFSSEDVECELFVEIHCALLKLLIEDDGSIAVRLPEIPDDDESNEADSSINTSTIPTPEPEAKPKLKFVGRRTTRSSFVKVEVVPLGTHRAAEMLADYDWVERLKKNDFRNGGWEVVVIGVLFQLSLNPKMKDVCESLLAKLAPMDEEPTQETARLQYQKLDINFRTKILQIICMLTIDTKAVRDYMDECSEQMTQLRKVKIEWQRAKRVATEELRQLEEERKILLPDNLPSLTELQTDTTGNAKTTGANVAEDEEEAADSDSEEPRAARSLRGGEHRAANRKRKREQEQEKKEKAEAAAKAPKVSNQFKKILKEIEKRKERIKECEQEITTQDNDLREADCFRTKVLGKDRFHNRYYWFERNGMPYAGLPTSSTASAGYANGCLWVQGPDDLERVGFIDVPDDENRQYQKKFKMTVAERKKLEEGSTSLTNACHWGYYDEPDSLKSLLSWIDIRGVKEVKLHKELLALQERITRYMEARKRYIALNEEKKQQSEEPTIRMSTRTKTYVGATSHRCLAWRNTTALSELGHLHSDPPRPTRRAAKRAELDRETRSGRQGKLPTRQGARYNF